jgi:glycosyltransferase involved in cell wall biosynthesis
MKWLIVEDSLQDRRGHWFEYVGTFCRELPKLGDEVVVAMSSRAEPFIISELPSKPILPASIYLQMSDGAGLLKRYTRVPWHAWHITRAVRRLIGAGSSFDVIFVPTVLVHHALAWWWLTRRWDHRRGTKLLLFFPGAPVRFDIRSGRSQLDGSPSSQVLRKILRCWRGLLAEGRVILGVETKAMQAALERVMGVPFQYLPHPVTTNSDVAVKVRGPLTFGAFGSARHEKGEDTLVAAVDQFCKSNPGADVRFTLQAVGGSAPLWRTLAGRPRVELIQRYFEGEEYARQLAATDALILPYRRSSYGLRLSRVLLEGVVRARPCVVSAGTTLAQQAREFGASIQAEEDNVGSVVSAIEQLSARQEWYSALARTRQARAQEHFSVAHFRSRLVRCHRSDVSFQESI